MRLRMPGDIVYGWGAAAATAITNQALLESAGNGTVRLHTPQAVDEAGSATLNIVQNGAIFRALEAVDNSGGGTAVRIKMEAL